MTGQTYRGFKCNHCGWSTKYTSSTTGALEHLKSGCPAFRLNSKLGTPTFDGSVDLSSAENVSDDTLDNKTLSQLTNTSSTGMSSLISRSNKKQTMLF